MSTAEERIAVLETQVSGIRDTLDTLVLKIDAYHEDVLVSRTTRELRRWAFSIVGRILWFRVPLLMWLQGGSWREISGFFKSHS